MEFDWSEISPTIFGAVFESTLNPETRRSAMHTRRTTRQVMQAYGFSIKDMTEAGCVAELMKLYQNLTEKME